MYKYLKTPAVGCLEIENHHVYRKLLNQKQYFFKWINTPNIAASNKRIK